MSTDKKSQRSKKTAIRRETTDGNASLAVQNLHLPKFKKLSLIMPDKLQTRLVWSGIQQITVASGFHTSYRYMPSAAFDVDPALGSTAMPGYGELAQFYGSYRVVQSTIKVQIVSPTTGTASAVVLPMNQDPGATPSFATVAAYPGSPYSQYKIVPASSAPPTTFEMTMSSEKIFGSKAVYFDDAFSALTNAVPSNNWYWAIGIITPTSVTSQGYTLMVKLEVDVEFFNRNFLIS